MGLVGIYLSRWDSRDNSRLRGNRRSGRLGPVGSGGLDSARQVVGVARLVNGDATEREGREKRHSKRERDTERNSNGVGKTVWLHGVSSSARCAVVKCIRNFVGIVI